VTTAGYWTNQESIVRPDGFPSYQWLQAVSGKGVLRTDGRELIVGPGQGMLLMANEAHEYEPLEAPWGVHWIGFDGPRAAEMLRDLGYDRSDVLFISNPDATLKTMMEITSLLGSYQPAAALEASAALYRLLLDLHRYGSRTELRSRKHHLDAIAPALEHMEKHYARTIPLDELARLVGFTPQHVCFLFQQALGLRPIEFLTRVRIRKAKELLLNEPDLEVQTVAARVGYDHPSYFIKLFKQQEGVTPVMFRRIHSSRNL
jgi:AraC-like DNA-binding protein